MGIQYRLKNINQCINKTFEQRYTSKNYWLRHVYNYCIHSKIFIWCLCVKYYSRILERMTAMSIRMHVLIVWKRWGDGYYKSFSAISVVTSEMKTMYRVLWLCLTRTSKLIWRTMEIFTENATFKLRWERWIEVWKSCGKKEHCAL